MKPSPHDLHPLSYGQRALWFLQKLAPGSAAYNVSFAGRLRTAVDGAALCRGFQALADRHPALRTTYPLLPEGEGSPLQRVHEHLEIDSAEIDAAAWDDETLLREVTAEAHRPIALDRPPVVRLRLFRRGPADGVLLLLLHHIAVDFRSLSLILADLQELLPAAFAGRPPALQPPAGRYADFARRQAEMLQGPEGERLWEYWRAELAGELPELRLPTDRPRPKVQSFRGGNLGFDLDAAACAGLEQLAAAAGTGLFAVVAAAFRAVLHRACGQDEIVLGSTLPGRPGPEMQDVVGYFVNTVLLRGDLAGDPTFRRLLAREARVVAGAVAHQHLPFPLLVERLAPERDLSRSPLYQVLLAFYEGGTEEQVLRLLTGGEGRIRLGPLDLEPFPLDRRTSMLDLTLNVMALPGRMSFSLQYDADLFDPATVERLVDGLRSLAGQVARDPDVRLSALLLGHPAQQSQLTATRRPEPIREGDDESDGDESEGDESGGGLQGIAIVGLAVRFPGAPDAGRFWENLCAGVESITFFDREELRAAGTDPALLDHPHFVRAAGRLEGVELFDAGFFQYNAREASVIDPQQRIFLECAWEALEDAACDPETCAGPIGVYAGVSASTWLYHLLTRRRPGDAVDWLLSLVGNDKDFVSTRTSYKLGLTGPSFTVQSACSTSLVATHLACQGLLNGECDVALAGGASIAIPQERGYLYSPAGIMSPDGHCRAFDARARGTVTGSGVGVVVLKRLEDALADGDRIRAVIRGSAVNNDGSHKAGFTAPSSEGQGRVIAEALAVAGVAPRTLSYVEAHGSGTPLGDTIEVAALSRVFAAVTGPRRCALGSVKTNLGHLDAAAGIAGLIKTALALEHRALPPSLHFEEPSPRLRLDEGPFYVPTRLSPWPAGPAPRRAGVSSFGLGGTNVHVVLEEAPEVPEPAPSRPWQLLLLSARTPGALEAATDRMSAHLAAHPEQDFADVAYTTQVGRRAFPQRRMLVCRDRLDAAAALAGRDPGRLLSGAEEMAGRPVAFVFPGLGEHHPEMGRGLYEQEPGFRERIDRCAELLLPVLGADLREVLYPARSTAHRGTAAPGGVDLRALLGRGPAAAADTDGRLDRTAWAHPALFAVEIALAGLWQDFGIVPQAVMGYSLGEYAAACIAGVFSLEDALLLVARRAQMIEELPEGAMLAVPLAAAEVHDLLGGGLALAAANGPRVSVVAGPPAEVEQLESRLAAQGLACRRLRTRHAFHCGLMEPVAERLTRLVAEVPRRAPEIPCLSNVTGTWLRPEDATDPAYWARHLLGTVRCEDNLAALWSEPGRILLETGPGQSLASLALQHPARAAAGTADALALPSLAGAYERQDDQAALLTALGRLWLAGVRVDWRRFHAGSPRRRAGLPTYPFERRRYGLDDLAPGTGPAEAGAPSFAAAGTSVHARPHLANAYVAPQTDLEHHIARLWQELLGVDQVGAHDSFFALGGHSLLATQVISRLLDALGIELSLEQIFTAPTVAELAAAIAAQGAAAESAAPQRAPIPRRSDPREAPLSFAQQRLWFIDQLEPGSPLYNVPVALRVEGPLDARVLELCLGELVRRHETLRTVFAVQGGSPMQVILPPAPFLLPVVDLSGLPEGRRAALAHTLNGEEAGRPFDLARTPQLRAALLRLAAEEHVVELTLHHIVCDSWSITILVREVMALYRAFAEGRPSPLPEPPVQYADYAEWQRSWLHGETLQAEIDFWRRQLAGLPPLLALPSDRPRPAVQGFRGSSRPVRWPPGLTRQAEALGRSEGATLFMVLLAAFQTLLARISGQQDVAVGTPVAGRKRVEVEGLIGFFLNTLVLRGDLSHPTGELSFRQLLCRVREVALAAYKHQDVPFERLVQELTAERLFNHTPLFQVMLVLQNAPAEDLAIESLRLRMLKSATTTAKFDLTINVIEEPNSALAGEAEYSTELFDAPTIDRLLGHLRILAESAVAHPEVLLSELPLLSDPERHQLLLEWNGTAWNGTAAAPFQGASLTRAFEAWAESHPGAVAAVCEGQALSYAALNTQANRLARVLRRLGIRAETRVGICLERSLDLIVAILATLKAGGAYVPLDPDAPDERLRFQLHDALGSTASPVLLTARNFARRFAAMERDGFGLVLVDAEESLARESPDNLPETAAADHLAYVIYTSGSTGRPKGVQVTHGNVLRLFTTTRDRFRIAEQDVWSLFHSCTFDFSVWEIWGALLHGGRLVVVPYWVSRSPDAFHRLLGAERVTVLSQTPSAFRQLIDADAMQAEAGGPDGPGALRLVIFGGEALDLAGLAPWIARHGDRRPRLVNMYGITETTVHVTCRPVGATDLAGSPWMSPLGAPLEDLRLHLLDRDLQPVPIGAVGEICVGGPGLARGYLDRPDLTAQRFIPDPWCEEPGRRLYRSGDLASRRTDGDVLYLGRIDHQVKIRGFRIELGEIEAALLEQSHVKQAVVVARRDGPSPQLLAYVVSADGEPVSPSLLREALLARLPAYMIPSAWMVLPSLPLTDSGKVDRRALPLPEAPSGGADHAAPDTPVEHLLAAVWAEVLQVETVGRHDNFFALGGDSILSIQVCARARKAGVRITPRLLFQHQTVATLATVADTSGVLENEQGLVTGPAPLTPVQRWFFDSDPAEPHHFNQSVLLETTAPLDPAPLRAALEHLERHHDALRLRFVHGEDGWRQAGGLPSGRAPLAVIDLAGLPAAARPRAVEDAAAQAQTRLDLQHGPLDRALLFHLGAQEPGRFFWAIHHLVVDGVSWRILLEDLAVLYRGLTRGGPAELPAKTTSFRLWAGRLAAAAAAPETEAELPFWLQQPWTAVSRLPLDHPEGVAANLVATESSESLQLDTGETRALLQEVPQAYNTRINDVLLSALAAGFRDWTGAPVLLVDLEGHGREEVFPDVDLSRTVGWFTSIHPVLLDLREASTPAASLQAVKEQLRRVPRGGLGYGLLRRAGPHAATLAALPQAEVLFNYLGQLDRALPADSPFREARESGGTPQSPRSRRSHLLVLNGGVFGGRLSLTCTFSTNVHRRETMRRLVDAVAARLRELIAHCSAPGTWGYTPSDFPLAGLDPAGLAALVEAQESVTATRARRPLEDVYPLSPMQQGMLFHTLYAPQAGAYVLQLSARILGPLDLTVFRKAWAGLLARHPVLRTSFHWGGGGQPLQVVRRTAEVPLAYQDWTELPEDARRERLATSRREDLVRGFDLRTAPLLRLLLVKEGESAHRLVWNTHLIVMDGWSKALVLRELFALYTALSEHRDPGLAAPPPYRDFISWLLRQQTGEAEAFWRRELAGLAGATPLPGDREPAGRPEIHQDRILLSTRTTEALQAAGRAAHLTLNTLLQGAWALLLARYAGEPEVVFGATVSGRPSSLPGIESMVGLFINSLPVRATASPAAGLRDWLRDLQDRQIAARHYDHVPLVDIQGWSPLPRGTPLFESLVVFENYPVDQALADGGPGLQIDEIDWKEEANYPLVLVVMPGRRLTWSLSWDRSRFSGAGIGRILLHLTALCEAVAAGVDAPGMALGDLAMLTAAEHHQILVEWNDTHPDGPEGSGVVHLFAAQAARTPEAEALVCEERRLTYGELDRLANRVAHHLAATGVGPGTVVGLCVERSPEMIAGLLGVWKAGAAYLPLDPAYPDARLALLLADARAGIGVPVVLTGEALHSRLAGFAPADLRPLCLETLLADGGMDPGTAPPAGPGDPAYLIYTSGTTGTPKAVVVENRHLQSTLGAAQQAFGFSAEDRMPCLAPFSFDIFLFELLGPLLAGGTSVLVPLRPTLDLRRLVAQLGELTRLHAVPALMRGIVEAARSAAPSPRMRTVFVGGDAVPPGLLADLRPVFPAAALSVLYGPTEATIICCHHRAEPADELSGAPLGRPLANAVLRLVGRGGETVPVGAVGELLIGGGGVARGYLGRPELEAERFIVREGRRWYRSGDLARHRPDGQLEFLGRLDDQVKVRGFRIELGEIEAAIARLPGVLQAVVAAADGATGRRLAAYVVPAVPGEDLATDGLRQALAEHLPEHMVPGVWMLLPALPLSPNGKVDRRALPAVEARQERAAYVAPASGLERSIAALWQEVLGLDRVGINESFFDLGGHSLSMMKLQGLLAERLGREVPMVDLFSSPTVGSLARLLAQTGEDAAAPSPEAREEREADQIEVGKARIEKLRRARRVVDV